mgnify:CR=1 FL=1
MRENAVSAAVELHAIDLCCDLIVERPELAELDRNIVDFFGVNDSDIEVNNIVSTSTICSGRTMAKVVLVFTSGERILCYHIEILAKFFQY